MLAAVALVHADNLKLDEDKKTEKRGIYSSGYAGGLGGLYDNGLYSPSAYLTPGGLPRSRCSFASLLPPNLNFELIYRLVRVAVLKKRKLLATGEKNSN